MAATEAKNLTVAGEAAAEILSQKLEMLLCHPERIRCLSTEKLVKDAKEKLAMIQDFFSTQDRPSKSMEWLGRLLRAMYEAEEFIDKFHLREASERHKALHVVTRPVAKLVYEYKLWRDLSSLVDKMQNLCQDQYLTGKTEKPPASSFSPASVPGQGEKKVRLTSYRNLQASYYLCRKEKKKEIIMRLAQTGQEGKGPIVNVTSIWGEWGTGKMFLARWVYREEMCRGVESCAWVRVSANMEAKEFMFEILRQMGKPPREATDMNLYEITEMLYNELAQKTKFVIVVDGVRPSNVQLLQRLVGLIMYLRQGHIITITQFKHIAESMAFFGAKSIKLDKLDDDESKKLLTSKLYRIADGQSLQDNEDILRTCGGLPLSLSLLGGLLSYAEEHERQEPRLSALLKDCPTVPHQLQLSYRRLPVHLKPCFIYMALFPVASPIPTRRLVRLWLAEGLLDSHCYSSERKRTRLPEDVGEDFILELVERNLIDVASWRADGSPKACQMLASLYDMIRPIAISMGFLHIHDEATKSTEQGQAQPRESKVRWLAEHTNIVRDGSNPSLNLGHVRSFLSFYLRKGMLTKDISTVLRNIISKTDYSLLRVLDLEGVYKPSLQGVLHKLLLLRYLGLRSTVLDSIPCEVAHLYYLETLDIKHTNITSLPSSLWKARNLRHLHLNWFYIDLKKILKACGNNVEALTKLQTLSGLVIGEVKESSMTGHMNSLTSLTTLKLFLQQSDKDTSSGAAGETVARWIRFGLTNLQSLTFGVIQEAKPAEEAELKKGAKPRKGSKLEEGGDGPTRKAKQLEEAAPEKSQIGALPELLLAEHHELLELYLLGRLKKPIWTRLLPDSLRVLTLSGSKVTTDMIPRLGNFLTNLRTLRLLANSFLGESMTFNPDGFPSLKILKIWKLPHLKEVNIQGGAMPYLEEVEFRHLDMLTTIEGISHCKELKNIWVISSSDAPPFLKHLKEKKGKDTDLHVEKPTDDDDDEDGDEKGETSDQESENESLQPTDHDDRDEKEETLDQDVQKKSSQSTHDGARDEKGETLDQHAEQKRPQSTPGDDSHKDHEAATSA